MLQTLCNFKTIKGRKSDMNILIDSKLASILNQPLPLNSHLSKGSSSQRGKIKDQALH